MPEKPEIKKSAKLFLLDRDSYLWLVRRALSARHRPGQWDLFGGGLEEDEFQNDDFKGAAIREGREETAGALQLARRELTIVYRSTLPSKQASHINQREFFWARTNLNPGIWETPHHSESRAVMPEDAQELLTHPPHAEALAIFIERVWSVELEMAKAGVTVDS